MRASRRGWKAPATTQPQCGAGLALQAPDSYTKPHLPLRPALTVAPAPSSRDHSGEQDTEEPETHRAELTNPGCLSCAARARVLAQASSFSPGFAADRCFFFRPYPPFPLSYPQSLLSLCVPLSPSLSAPFPQPFSWHARFFFFPGPRASACLSPLTKGRGRQPASGKYPQVTQS